MIPTSNIYNVFMTLMNNHCGTSFNMLVQITSYLKEDALKSLQCGWFNISYDFDGKQYRLTYQNYKKTVNQVDYFSSICSIAKIIYSCYVLSQTYDLKLNHKESTYKPIKHIVVNFYNERVQMLSKGSSNYTVYYEGGVSIPLNKLKKKDIIKFGSNGNIDSPLRFKDDNDNEYILDYGWRKDIRIINKDNQTKSFKTMSQFKQYLLTDLYHT